MVEKLQKSTLAGNVCHSPGEPLFPYLLYETTKDALFARLKFEKTDECPPNEESGPYILLLFVFLFP